MTRRLPGLGLALAAAWVLCGTALAQLASDDVPRERIVPEKEQLDRDLARARFHLGPLRLIPSVGITDAGYDNNVFATPAGAVGDWTFTAQAGLRMILPMGSKLILRGNVLPRYTWYDKLVQRRGWGGLYDASLFGFFNRMSVVMSGNSNEDFGYYSSEQPVRVKTTTRDASAGLELELARRFSIFGHGEFQRVRYSNAGQLPTFDATLNDRDDSAERAGVRYRWNPSFDVSAAYEQTRSDFETDPEFRNNKSRAYMMALHYDFPRLFITATGGYREGRARDGSTFPEYSTGTGSFFISYYPMRWLEVEGYGRRHVAYSVNPGGDPYYFEERIGGGLNVQVARPVFVRGYAEFGPNKYPSVDASGVSRRDDVTSFGGGLTLTIDRFAVTTLVSRDEYTSNQAFATRAFTRFTMGITFNQEFVR